MSRIPARSAMVSPTILPPSRKCIDVAREHGRGSIAYLPSGGYNLSQTLTITGKDYTVGGSGFRTMLNWKGDEGGSGLPEGRVTIQNPKFNAVQRT